jgi:segregation and condensation protein B
VAEPAAPVSETAAPPDGEQPTALGAQSPEFRTVISEASEPVTLSLEALVESLLFVADGAVPVGRLAEALEVNAREVEAALAGLGESFRHRGLSLQRFRDRVQLTTAPAAAEKVQRFLGLAAATPLSRAALETLAIIAYQQPVTRPQIEAVRGVNSDSVIKNLLSKGLVEELGRAEGPGRPVLYSTTTEFMQHFGLASLGDLPPLSLPEAGPAPSAPAAEDVGVLKG